MRLGRVVRDGVDGPEVRLVAVYPDSDEVIDLLGAERARLEREGASPEAAERLARALFPPSMASAITAQPWVWVKIAPFSFMLGLNSAERIV